MFFMRFYLHKKHIVKRGGTNICTTVQYIALFAAQLEYTDVPYH